MTQKFLEQDKKERLTSVLAMPLAGADVAAGRRGAEGGEERVVRSVRSLHRRLDRLGEGRIRSCCYWSDGPVDSDSVIQPRNWQL